MHADGRGWGFILRSSVLVGVPFPNGEHFQICFSLRVRHPSAILAALISLCRAQGLVEPSLRQRYHIRRQNIAARRRRIGLAVGGIVLLIILGVAILRRPTPVSAPGVLAPTSAAMRTPSSAAPQTPTGQ